MLIPPGVKTLIRLALEEDLGRGDLTGLVAPVDQQADAEIIAREDTVVAAPWLVEAIIQEASAKLTVNWKAAEGELVAKNKTLLELKGSAREILALERTILNFLQRTCGIAQAAREYKALIGNFQVRITDTRKTLPGWRFLDKNAVKVGGLHNHRFGLDGGILVKENHIRAAGGIRAAVVILKKEVPHGLKIQVEVTNRTEALEAVGAGAEALLLDNFLPQELKQLVSELKHLSPSLLCEASGGIDRDTISAFAQTGVDLVSIGALTHSVKAANLSLLFKLR
jgi:nicotinate-nucleotide pyrophosphorylase (carboxylating)